MLCTGGIPSPSWTRPGSMTGLKTGIGGHSGGTRGLAGRTRVTCLAMMKAPSTQAVTLMIQAGRGRAVVVAARAGQQASEQVVTDRYEDPTGLLVVKRDGADWTVHHVRWPHGTLTIKTGELPVKIDADDQSITYSRVA